MLTFSLLFLFLLFDCAMLVTFVNSNETGNEDKSWRRLEEKAQKPGVEPGLWVGRHFIHLNKCYQAHKDDFLHNLSPFKASSSGISWDRSNNLSKLAWNCDPETAPLGTTSSAGELVKLHWSVNTFMNSAHFNEEQRQLAWSPKHTNLLIIYILFLQNLKI